MEDLPILETQAVETQSQPSEPQQEKVSDKFTFLAKKEAGIVKAKQALRAEMEAIAREKAEIQNWRKQIESAENRKSTYKSNPLAVLEDHGLTYKELTDYILNNNTVSTEAQIKALHERIEQQEKQRELERQELVRRENERHAEREAQVIQEFKTEIENFVKRESEKYELTNLYDSQDLVYDTVEEYFNKTGKVLSIPEACDLVEAYLEKQVEKSLATKKLSIKVATKAPEDSKVAVKDQPRRTLSNTEYTSSTPSFVSPKVENDRMSRALAALEQ